MKRNNFYMLYQHDIIKSVKDLATETSKVKSEIFKSTLMNKDTDKQKIRAYLSFVNDYLGFWEAYAIDTAEKAKNAKGFSNIKVISYADIKDHIYAKYDYGSIVKFVDGIINQVNDKLEKAEDINAYFDQCIDTDFKDRPNSVAGLLDDVVSNYDGEIADLYQAKMFETVKKYKMFNDKDRIVIYKAIVKIMDFMSNSQLVGKHFKFNDVKKFIAVINNIMEYMTYELVLYSTRTYVIGRYLYEFIYASQTSSEAKPIPVKESASIPSAGGESIEDMQINIIRSIDERSAKKLVNREELLTGLKDFISTLGGSYKIGDINRRVTDYPGPDAEQNVFSQALMGNPLYRTLVSYDYDTFVIARRTDTAINELSQILKDAIYNNNAIEGTSSAKHEILHVIRGTEYDHTNKAIQEIATDLFRFAAMISFNMYRYVESIDNWKRQIAAQGLNKFALSLNNNVQTVEQMLNEVYEEIMEAVLQKALDVEQTYNEINTKEVDSVLSKLNLDITNTNNQPSTNHSTNAVPDTTRIPLELSALYALPAFESMMMYDEYLKTLPMFESDMYFSEAFSIHTIINEIISFFKGSWKAIDTFMKDQKVRSCLDWVKKNEKTLMDLDFSKIDSIQVLDYKEKVELDIGIVNLKKASDFENFKTVEDFSKAIYPSDTIRSWFASDDKAERKKGMQRYHNLMLFQDEANVTDVPPGWTTLKGPEIGGKVKIWINTIKSVNAAYKRLQFEMQEIDKIISDIKSKATNTTKQQKDEKPEGAEPMTTETDNNNNNNNNNKDKQQNTSDAQKQGEEQGKKDASEVQNNGDSDLAQLNGKLLELQKALKYLWGPVPNAVVKIVKNEYGYLKQLYDKAK